MSKKLQELTGANSRDLQVAQRQIEVNRTPEQREGQERAHQERLLGAVASTSPARQRAGAKTAKGSQAKQPEPVHNSLGESSDDEGHNDLRVAPADVNKHPAIQRTGSSAIRARRQQKINIERGLQEAKDQMSDDEGDKPARAKAGQERDDEQQ
jgi:hypothetical protein